MERTMSDRRSGTSPERPIRVCFVIDNLSGSTTNAILGGTESQLMALIERLDRTKIIPYLCLLDGDNGPSRQFEPQDCEILRLGVRSICRPSTLPRAYRFGRFLRKERIDVVQAYFPDSTYFAVPVARLARVPRIVRTCRNLGYWMKPIDRWIGRFYSLLVDATVANCRACRQAVIANEWAAAESVAVVPNAVDAARFAHIPEPAVSRHRAGPLRVGAVANLRPVKDLDLLVRAAKTLAAVHPAARFRIAGEGPLRGELERLIERLGLSDRFELSGAVSDVVGFLGGLDVAVLCSRSEGLSNAMLEYMAAARPIVATLVGGNSELIEHQRHGLLVRPGDAPGLAAAIDRLLRDPALARRLGANARQRILGQYSTDRLACRYEAFFHRLVEKECRQPLAAPARRALRTKGS